MKYIFPENLKLLHGGEEELYLKSCELIQSNPKFLLHLNIIESCMEMLDIFRQFPTEEEDLKVIQVSGMRLFNAFASSLKLILSGYYQNGTMILRDILETLFLVDRFRTDRPAIERWRLADKKERLKEFKPVLVRKYLDSRDNFTGNKRAAIYDLLLELASHFSMQSISMLRPKDMDARNGPFVDSSALEAILFEMGRLAVQVGETVDAFFPENWEHASGSRLAFLRFKNQWISEFYAA